MHGFGGSRVETTGVFVALARRLAAAGIGVVAYDRAGHGESDGEFLDTTVMGDVADAGTCSTPSARCPRWTPATCTSSA
ncbi:putative lysophospholipase [Clavibacter michiganensis subsp. michiganensis]|uniref:Putative lysophospholipase n=1 Tax=Clavibacter michiganensis subsp. michiganensis TaxID=33013 RepID=A0A251XP61_CLAMM|nr:putative lysophospholipase [Clavibacter michiganensis subsp. michiganensis]OUE05216.1 putative lysophospholipase [Clavibacter michiganensis subsp. michiganensis]